MGLAEQIAIADEAKNRARLFAFGDPVTNVCAGENNPQKRGFFVELVKRTGQVNKGLWVRCTDKKGNFWVTGAEVIYPGFLDYEECKRLFQPVWDSQYKA